MDNMIFLGIVGLSTILFAGLVYVGRKLNVTKKEAEFAQKLSKLFLYLYHESDVKIKNKEIVDKALFIVEKSVDMFLETYHKDDVAHSRDIIFAYAKEVAEENGVTVDDEFVHLLVDVIDFYIDEVYVEKGLGE